MVIRARAGMSSGSDSVNTFRSHSGSRQRHFRLCHNNIGRSGPIRRSRGRVVTRSFGDEHQLLQRESKGGHPLLTAIAYSTVAAIALSLLALLAWALHRLAVGLRPAPFQRRLRLRGLPGFQHGGGR